ncbi:hypothetical protein V8F20_010154 [Naviculisporaceae sp. PSN 640]
MSTQSAAKHRRPSPISSVLDTDPSSAKEVDIICVHGLNPPRDTFRLTQGAPDQDPKPGDCSWLAPHLPIASFTQARIEVFSYCFQDLLADSKGIRDAALKLLQHLSSINTQNALKAREPRNLIFVCHSLGGLVVKEALIISSKEEEERPLNDNIRVARRTRGIIFLGTPHSTDLERLSSQIHLITLTDSPAGGETIGMAVKAAILQNFRAFGNLCVFEPPWQIISFYEELPLGDKPDFGPVVGLKDTYLYNQQQVGLHVNHEGIARFRDPNSPLCKALEASLKRMLRIASSTYPPGTASGNPKHEGLVRQNSHPLAARQDVLKSIDVGNGEEGISPGLEGTCSWILSSPIFNNWCADPDRRVLYIQGHTASGKTTLMKFISDRLRMEKHSGITAAFFFRHTEKPCKTQFLKSILSQILTESASYPYDLVSAYLDKTEAFGRHGRGWDWSEAELEGHIRQSILRVAHPSQPFTLILDGIDGCPDEEPVCSFVEGVLKIPFVRVCISSRPNPLFDTCELLRLRLRLEDHTAGDIQHYTSSKLKSLGISPDATATIAHRIVEKSKGVFLWAHLVVLNLPPPWCDEAMFSYLDHIPTVLDQLYAFILNGMLDDSETRRAELLKTVFRWILCSLRPLTFREIVEVLLVSNSHEVKPLAIYEPYRTCAEEMRVTSSKASPGKPSYYTAEKFEHFCGGLLKVDVIPHPGRRKIATSPGVYFIHETVRDFLLRDLPRPKTCGEIQGGEGHRLLASSCLGYLSATPIRREDDGQRPGLKLLRPLLEYSVMYLMEHIRLADQYGADCKEFAFALTREDFAERWIILYNAAVDHQTPVFKQGWSSIYHILSYFDLFINTFVPFLPTFAQANQKDHMGRTPLIMAAARGTRRAVYWLLRNGANPEIRDEIYGQNPLAWATVHGRFHVVQDLLDAGAVIDDTESKFDLLSHAVARGHIDIVRLLLSHGARVHSPTPATHLLSLAALTGRKFLVELLIAHGADPLATDGDGDYTPLHYAILGRRKRTLEQLLMSIPDHQLGNTNKFSHSSGARTWVDRIFMVMILGIRHRGTGSSPASSHASKNFGTNRLSDNPAPAFKIVKRPRDDDDNSDNEEGDERPLPPRKQMRSTGAPNFACPYYKRYPDKYRRACASPGFPDCHRLIQHLKKSHFRGDNFPRCPRCKHIFPKAEFEAHQNQPQACDPRPTATDYEEGFDSGQMRSLTAKEMKPKHCASDADRWVKTYRILFPDCSGEIPSPYHDQVEIGTLKDRMCSDESLQAILRQAKTDDIEGLRLLVGQLIQTYAFDPPAALTSSPEQRRSSPANPVLVSSDFSSRDLTTTMSRPLKVTGTGSLMRLGEQSPYSHNPRGQGHLFRDMATPTHSLSPAHPSSGPQFPLLTFGATDRRADSNMALLSHLMGPNLFPGDPSLGAECEDPMFHSRDSALSNQDNLFEPSSSQPPAEGADWSSECQWSWSMVSEADVIPPAAATTGDEGLVNYPQTGFPSAQDSILRTQSAHRRLNYPFQAETRPSPPPISPRVQQPYGPSLTWHNVQPLPSQPGPGRHGTDFQNAGSSPDVSPPSAFSQGAPGQTRDPFSRPSQGSGLGQEGQPNTYQGYF